IGVGFDQADAIAKVALKFPNTHFAIIDVDQQALKGKPKNVLGLLFREQEAGYLVGYLAGVEAKKLGGPQIVSTVGGEKPPRVDSAVFLTIRSVQNGTFKGGTDAVFGLDRNGVGVGKVSSRVPASALTQLKTIESKIKTNTIGTIPTVVK